MNQLFFLDPLISIVVCVSFVIPSFDVISSSCGDLLYMAFWLLSFYLSLSLFLSSSYSPSLSFSLYLFRLSFISLYLSIWTFIIHPTSVSTVNSAHLHRFEKRLLGSIMPGEQAFFRAMVSSIVVWTYTRRQCLQTVQLIIWRLIILS